VSRGAPALCAGSPGQKEVRSCANTGTAEQFHADNHGYMDESRPAQREGNLDVKQRNLRQAGQSGDALNASRTADLAKSRSVSPAVYAASIYFLLQSMSFLGVIDKLMYGPAWPGRGGTKITFALNLLSIFVSLFLFWLGTRKTRKASSARFNKILPLVAASFLLVSAFWSVEPRLTLTQGTAYFFAVLGAIGLVQALDGDELMDLVSLACGLSAVASLVWQFLLFPEPDFNGIFTQKNVLGQVMAGGVFAALHSIRIREAGRLRYICIIALCTTVGFLSKSSTAVVAIAALFCLDFLGRLYFKGGSSRAISICLSIGCVLALLFFSMNGELIYEFLGKDATLTGRTLIWPYVIDNISEKPLLGWGFAAFWVPGNPAALQIAQAVNWNAPNAHNGLLELLLEIGLVGTSLFVFLWVRNLVMARRCMNGPAQQFGLTSMLLLITILVIGMTEEVLLAAQHIWTGLFFMTGFICEKELRPAPGAGRSVITRSAARRHAESRAREARLAIHKL
jgi:exopolysaccharide production protein ExoQ